MNADLFNLRTIRSPRLEGTMLQQAASRIGRLTEGWEGGGTASFEGLLDEFRERMREDLRAGQSFEECTTGRRREWLLLKLYLNDLGAEESRAWLPPLDKDVAVSILGEDSKRLKRHLRRLATQLYFTHFDLKRLPCLEWLAERLRQAWGGADPERLDADGLAWRSHADELFCKHAPDEVARNWQDGMTVSQLAQAYHIPEVGIFLERLHEAVILNRILEMPLNSSDSSLNEVVIAEKERILRTGKPLGAAAVQILIERSKAENRSSVPPCWSELLVTYACDPRIPNGQLQSHWWSWANRTDKDIAIRAIGELNMIQFIKLLEESLHGSSLQHQFPARKQMLLRLFELGKIQDVRLVVTRRLYEKMDPKTRGLLLLNWVNSGSRGKGNVDTSFICMKCVDDVYLIEATGSFGLRGFIGSDSFPIDNFWNSQPKGYYDHQLRVNQYSCSVYQIHHTGNWVRDFVYQLRTRNIEWRGLS